MAVLGLSVGEGRCAVALAQDGTVVAAVDERRFGGTPPYRHPAAAMDWCLGQTGLAAKDIAQVVVAEARLSPAGLSALWKRPRRRREMEHWLAGRGLGGKVRFVAAADLPAPPAGAVLGVEPAPGAAAAALSHSPAVRQQAIGTDMALPPTVPVAQIDAWLDRAGAYYPALDEMSLVYASAEYLSLQMSLAWFEGEAEPGLRPIGGRAILADPRPEAMTRILGRQIKRPEAFGALAAVVPAEAADHWFDFTGQSAGGLEIGRVRDPAAMPAVCRPGRLARVRRIEAERLPRLHAMLRRFAQITGHPVLAAEALALSGEPVAQTHEAAFRVFMGSGLDVMTIGSGFIRKRCRIRL